ncbi:putative superfamily III holin-X [Litoreibacter meonggei]|uniref:Putative superfamily III holin-X n=1 Tax=Litoreibacter meonggei TaxID=1049199 RepID=A0A497WEW3_9RHOB|nr:putative superfamily III holin-X [Litoreibacter meonggei]
MFNIEQKVAKTARKVGLLSGGLLLCSIGIGFLTVAGWLALAPIVGVQLTATIMAGLYLGVGCIMIGISSRNSHSPEYQKQAEAPVKPEGPPVMQAFMFGLQAGAKAEQARR